MAIKSETNHKIITFFLTFWILGASIIRKDTFVLNFEGLGGDLQVKRIIFLILAGYLIFISLVKFRELRTRLKVSFEKYLYFFIVWYLVVLAYHTFGGTVKFKEFFVMLQGITSVLVLFLVLKRDADKEMILVFARALIMVSVVSSLVAIIQFFIAQDFMRIGSSFPAFGGRLRSNGIYWSEYIHSYTLVAATALTLVTIQSRSLKTFLIGLFLIGIILSFHRMSWVVTFVVFSLYLIIAKRQNVWKLIVIGGILVFTLVVVSTTIVPFMDEITSSDVYQSRISSDTMTNRLKFYNMVFERIDKIFLWGAGSRSSSLYYYGMLSTGVVGKEWALGEVGSIHNLYLEILFFYGAPLLLLFCIMLYSMLKGYLKLFFEREREFLFFYLFTVIYCLMNLTNAFPFQGDFGFLFGIVAGCSVAMSTKQISIMT